MSRRRYKIGVHPAYDAEFDLKKGSSAVLNHKHGRGDIALSFWSESGVRSLLREWEGTEDGLFEERGNPDWVKSHLKTAQEAIDKIDEQFEAMKIRTQRAGRYPPEKMPEEMVEKKLVLEARLDIIGEEIDLLKREIAKYAAKEKEQEEHLILAYGPRGSTQGADPPRCVDGQPIKWDETLGHFVIDCKKSPYHGVTLPNYYAFVCKPWRDKKNELYAAAHARFLNLDLSEGERKRAGEEEWRILNIPDAVPWPPRPEGV